VLALVLALILGRPVIAVLTAVADGLGELVSAGLQAVIPRSRPHLDPLVSVPHTHSFLSGHATTGFACATVLGAAVPRLRTPLYLLAALVAWSRVYVGVHYPSDVFAGALLGLATGLIVTRGLPRLAGARLRRGRGPRAG